jgi:hypothetical protein
MRGATRTAIGLLLATVAVTAPAFGQKATERYIPIGRSPGLSEEQTSIGEIVEVEAEPRTITVAGREGHRYTVSITDETLIWLDRTPIRKTNLSGTFEDLRKGRRVEVKYKDPQRRELAEWVKVEITEPSS